MPIRRSPNGARHVRPQPGRNRPEWVVAINRNAWSLSVGIGGRNHPVRSAASEKFDRTGPDAEKYEAMQTVRLTTDDAI